jgi:alkylation response protein AidB-like acyl-CoA dehydrogenase
MNFGFDEQQELLRHEVRKFLDEQCPLETVRQLAKTPSGYSPELWKQLGELGWLGLILPEQYGGGGMGWVDLTVLLEEVGRSLFPGPLVSTLLAGATIADGGSASQHDRWLPGLADGSRIGTLALLDNSSRFGPEGIGLRAERDGDTFVITGELVSVPDVAEASLFIVAFRTDASADDVTLAVIEADSLGLTATTRAGIDATKRFGTLRLEGVRVASDAVLGEPGAGWNLAATSLDRGAAATTAEIIGAAEALTSITVQYAKDRVQFGHPIGHYQGVKHPLAEAYVDCECMKSLAYYAAWALEESPDEVPAAVSKAKGFASEAFTRIGVTGIQLHGAVGYTEEYDCQLYLKRSKWARPAYGDEDYHYERVATLGGV